MFMLCSKYILVICLLLRHNHAVHQGRQERLLIQDDLLHTVQALAGKVDTLSNKVSQLQVELNATRQAAENSKWELVFRVRAETGGSTYEGFVNGHGTDSSQACKMKSIRCMYRSGVVANWQNENIQRVLYSIKKQDKQVAFIEFFARGRNTTNWFSAGNVVDSSWSDLRGNTFNYFSIGGFDNSNPLRHFFVNKNYGGCSNDAGWTVILDGMQGCIWGQHSAYPAILYANSNGVKKAEPNGFDVADEMEIYVNRDLYQQ